MPYDFDLRAARPGLVAEQVEPLGRLVEGSRVRAIKGDDRSRHHDGQQRPSRLSEPLLNTWQIAHLAGSGTGFVGGAGEQFAAEGGGVIGQIGHFDGGDQAVVKVAEAAFEEQRHAAVAQADERPAAESSGRGCRPGLPPLPASRTPAGDGRHFARTHQDRQVVERQADPEHQPEPDHRQGQPFQPDIEANPPPQGPPGATARSRSVRRSGYRRQIVVAMARSDRDLRTRIISVVVNPCRIQCYGEVAAIEASTPVCSTSGAATPSTEHAADQAEQPAHQLPFKAAIRRAGQNR